ncbi:MAG: BON domain-containing protein [Pseudomonadota bacterium]
MNKPTLPLLRAAAVLAFAASLQGCVALVVGGAAAGAVATFDRRSIGAQTEDKAIAVKAELRIPKVAGPDAHVNTASFNRVVLLTGEVKDEAAKAAVEKEVRAIDGVVNVANELTVGAPATYVSRSNDALITTKVKAGLANMQTISAGSYKVVTERGIVYLMGRVTQREGQVGADVARSVGGVTQVVKLFDYISEEEMRALSPIKPSTQL